MTQHYQLWDTEAGRLLGAFACETAALDAAYRGRADGATAQLAVRAVSAPIRSTVDAANRAHGLAMLALAALG